MLRFVWASIFLVAIALGANAGERVSATNFYVVKQERFSAGFEVYWTEDNIGSFTVHEGPIDSGFARCVGSGFGSQTTVTGDGICIYGENEDTFTMKWEIIDPGVNRWKIVSGSGKYLGMTGNGTTKTRVDASKLKLPHRVSGWEGEVDVPSK